MTILYYYTNLHVYKVIPHSLAIKMAARTIRSSISNSLYFPGLWFMVEIKLDKEIVKRQKLEKEVAVLTTTNKHQADIIRAKKPYSSSMTAADSNSITEKGSWEIP